MGKEQDTVTSLSNLSSQTSSPITCLMPMYSASTNDKEIVDRFLDFQHKGLYPMSTTYTFTNLLELGQVAQPESQNAEVE